MRVSQIKELLSEYSDDTELMIAFNDKENLLVDDDQTWRKAVEIYEDSEIYGFNDDCRWAIGEAEQQNYTAPVLHDRVWEEQENE